jgi:hypothetical protein
MTDARRPFNPRSQDAYLWADFKEWEKGVAMTLPKADAARLTLEQEVGMLKNLIAHPVGGVVSGLVFTEQGVACLKHLLASHDRLVAALQQKLGDFQFLAAVPPHSTTTLIKWADERAAEVQDALAKLKVPADD